MSQSLEDFTHFIAQSPTAFHAAKEITNRLAEADFIPLSEGEKWRFEPGKGYFVMRGDSLVAAFRIPKKAPISAVILASHVDSPCLKIKPHPEISQHSIGQLGTEVYGAPLLHTWLDRDLCIAGRITVIDSENKIQSLLVSLDDYPIIIPGLAIHLDRNISEKGILVHKQDHLKAIFTLNAKEKHLENWLHKHHSFKKLLSFDLFLVPLEKPAFLGFENEMLAAYRLDNLTATYASLQAMIESEARTETLQMAFFWDHEEIGSHTFVGADSLFADQLLERICSFFKMDREEVYRLKSRSICLSGDLGHGFHPNYSDKYDPQHLCLLGHGVALKFNANQKYATNSTTAASILQLAEKHKIPIQKFVSRSDIPSGSTVGSLMAASFGIQTLDLGIVGWSMHSAREVIGAKDELALMKLFSKAMNELPGKL